MVVIEHNMDVTRNADWIVDIDADSSKIAFFAVD